MLQSDWKDEYLWDLDSARTYCESGNPINSRNADGMTPLMLAAGSGADLEILQILVTMVLTFAVETTKAGPP